MNDRIKKINFSRLSKGEQQEVYRNIAKAQMCQKLSVSEAKFIDSMALRGERSEPDQLNKTWAELVSNVGINAGFYVSKKVLNALEKSEPGSDEREAWLFMELCLEKCLKPLGGSVEKTTFMVVPENAEVVE